MSEQPAEITYRRMRAADLEACLALSTLQGWNQLREDWAMFLAFQPRECFVACVGDRLVGTLTAIDYGGRVAWIGMLLVHPDLRRRGVGRGLMTAALEALGTCETIKLDATPAGRPLYAQLGFVDEYELSRLTAARAKWSAIPAGAASVEPCQATDLEDVLALDLPVFGVDRRRVVARWYERLPQAAWVTRRDGRITGYAMGRPGAHFATIGPVIATSEADACALAAAVGGSFADQAIGLDLVAGHSGFRTWLERCGFTFQRPLARMYRGPNRYPGIPARQFCVLGPEVG